MTNLDLVRQLGPAWAAIFTGIFASWLAVCVWTAQLLGSADSSRHPRFAERLRVAAELLLLLPYTAVKMGLLGTAHGILLALSRFDPTRFAQSDDILAILMNSGLGAALATTAAGIVLETLMLLASVRLRVKLDLGIEQRSIRQGRSEVQARPTDSRQAIRETGSLGGSPLVGATP